MAHQSESLGVVNGVDVGGLFKTIDADTPPGDLGKTVKPGPGCSPTFDTITRAVSVTVQLGP